MHMNLNTDRLLARMWEMLAMVRVYTRRRGEAPDLNEPSVLTQGRGGVTIRTLCQVLACVHICLACVCVHTHTHTHTHFSHTHTHTASTCTGT